MATPYQVEFIYEMLMTQLSKVCIQKTDETDGTSNFETMEATTLVVIAWHGSFITHYLFFWVEQCNGIQERCFCIQQPFPSFFSCNSLQLSH